MSQDDQQSRAKARQAVQSELDRRLGLPDRNRKLTAVSLEQLEKAVKAWRRERGMNRNR